MKNYQKPEVEIIKFETVENIMSSVGGDIGTDIPGSDVVGGEE